MPKPNSDGGYILPLEPDAPRICIEVPLPDALEHKIAFLGQLEELARWWTWQRDEAHSARLVAAIWRGILNNVRAQLDIVQEYCMLPLLGVRQNEAEPCILEYTTDSENWLPFADLRLCTPNLRINGATGRLEASTDGLEWFEVADGPTDWPDDQVPPSLRPAPTNPEPASDLLACGIAIALTTELERAWDQAYANEDDLLTSVSTGVITGSAALSVLFPGALIPAAGIALLVGAARVIVGLISQSEVNAFDEDANERYRCYLFDILNGSSSYDHSSQEAWAAAIEADAENSQADAIARLLRAVPVETMQWLAYAASPVNDLAACPCDEPECANLTETFTGGPSAATTVTNGTYDGTRGHNAAGCMRSVTVGGNIKNITAEIDLGLECTINRVEIWYYSNTSGSQGWVYSYVRFYDDAHAQVGAQLTGVEAAFNVWNEAIWADLNRAGVRYIEVITEQPSAADAHWLDDIEIIVAG